MNFIKDTKGTMVIYWLFALLGLLFIIIGYAIAIPLGNIFINIFSQNGTPLAQMLYIRSMTIWGFLITGVFCILFAFVSNYKKTYDQGYTGR